MPGFFQFFNRKPIIVVSGLPRSGTSMMMRMLDAGGMDVAIDHLRKPDEDNPRGYYELERVKQIGKDADWLKDVRGKAVKIVSTHLPDLPLKHAYKVIFMRRQLEEILSSQRQMLARNGKLDDYPGDEEMSKLYAEHLEKVESWLKTKSNFQILYLSYNDLLEDPVEGVRGVNLFLGSGLDEKKMISVIDPELYRQRA